MLPDQEIDAFNELRMMIAIGQQPDVWILSDQEHVGKCVNVDAAIEDGSLVISADYQSESLFMAVGAEVCVPSGGGFSIMFGSPREVAITEWVKLSGTVSMEIT